MIKANLLSKDAVLFSLGNKRGQTLVEYALILSIISVVAVSVMIALSGHVKTVFTTVDQQVAIAGNGGPAATPPGHGGG